MLCRHSGTDAFMAADGSRSKRVRVEWLLLKLWKSTQGETLKNSSSVSASKVKWQIFTLKWQVLRYPKFLEIWPAMYRGFFCALVVLHCVQTLPESSDSLVWVAASWAQLALENSLWTTWNLRPLEWWPGLNRSCFWKSRYGMIWKLKISNLQNYFLVLNLYSTDAVKSWKSFFP